MPRLAGIAAACGRLGKLGAVQRLPRDLHHRRRGAGHEPGSCLEGGGGLWRVASLNRPANGCSLRRAPADPLACLCRLQAWKTPSLLIYAAVRRVGPGGHALPPASVFPSLEVVPVSQDVWAWRYARPHQPLLSHLRAMLPRMPSRIPGPGDIVAIDAEFVATSTQEVRSWQRL